MNIVMSYIDYNMAGLAEREIFSCTSTQTEEIYHRLLEREEILGAVLIATCNRTELYLNLKEGTKVNPFEELCRSIDVKYEDYAFMNKTLSGEDAIVHLCKVAAGAESQIWGEDQIISQVRESITRARALKASDTILNVVFRTGVSAGKKVKTLVDFKVDDNSTAARAVGVIKKNPEVNHVLIIGNGMIGRLVGELLIQEGIEATMTLRQYKHGDNIVPKGCKTVNYNDRYQAMEHSDAVISATLSPHHTVYYDQIQEVEDLPRIFIDLAVPRDIDPLIEGIEGVDYYNIDDISRDTRTAKQEEQLKQIEQIIEKYIDDFYKWYEFREKMIVKECDI
ncbi:glutamyl-tRNA reductase [Clostridiales Family XIII bacterium PM5-7]